MREVGAGEAGSIRREEPAGAFDDDPIAQRLEAAVGGSEVGGPDGRSPSGGGGSGCDRIRKRNRTYEAEGQVGAQRRVSQGVGVGGAAADASGLDGLEGDGAVTGAGEQSEESGADGGLAHAGVGPGDEETRDHERATELGEGVAEGGHLVGGVLGGEGDAQPGRAFGNRGRADRLDEEAALEECPAGGEGARGPRRGRPG